MREILFIAHRLPFPPDRGDKIRSYHLLQALARIAPVHLAGFADDASELAQAEQIDIPLASRCIVQRSGSRTIGAAKALASGKPLSLGLFDSTEIRRFVREKLATGQIGCIFAFSGQMAQFVPDDRHGARFIMDFVDVDSAKFERYARTANPLMRIVYEREARTLATFEARVAQQADLSLFVSEMEANLFRVRSGASAACVRALENGVDMARFDPAGRYETPQKTGPLIVFTGQMDYRPNIEAVQSFARDAMPLLRVARPDAKFAIVGRKPDAAVRALSDLPGVIVTGEVPDVRGWLAAADVVVAPLRIARGVQNKVLEAMAMARPVVASHAAFEGIAAEPGTELIIADDSADEARAVLALLDDAKRAAAIGRAARARIERNYGWDAQLADLPAITGFAPAPLLDAAE